MAAALIACPWECVYLMYASLLHLPSTLMTLVDIPACAADVAPPMRKLCVLLLGITSRFTEGRVDVLEATFLRVVLLIQARIVLVLSSRLPWLHMGIIFQLFVGCICTDHGRIGLFWIKRGRRCSDSLTNAHCFLLCVH